LSEKFFYEGLVVFDFDPRQGTSIYMPWRHTDGGHEDLAYAAVEEGLGVELKESFRQAVEISGRVRITVEFL